MKASIEVSKNELYRSVVTSMVVAVESSISLTSMLKVEIGQECSIHSAGFIGAAKSSLNPISVAGSGSFLVDAKTFKNALTNIPEQIVRLSLDGGNANLSYSDGLGEFNFSVGNSDDFPKSEFIRNDNPIVLPSKILKGMLITLKDFMSNDAFRPALSGIHINTAEDGLEMVASDGYILGVKKTGLKIDTHINEVIPSYAVNALVKVLNNDKDVYMYIHPRSLNVFTDYASFSFRLAEGKFPNYKSMVAIKGAKVDVPIRKIEESLKIISSVSFPSTTVEMKFESDRLLMSALSFDMAVKSEESIPTSSSVLTTKSLNASKTLSIAKVMPDDCEIYIEDGKTPVMFLSESLVCIQMPIITH